MKKNSVRLMFALFLTLIVSACSPYRGEGGTVSVVIVNPPIEESVSESGDFTVEDEEPTTTVVPPLEYLSFVSWNRPFPKPMPDVEGEIVLAYDDFGNSQLFYGCSQERIEKDLNLEKFSGIYFSIYWGWQRDADLVMADARQRIDTGSMAAFLQQENWELLDPEVTTCSVKMAEN